MAEPTRRKVGRPRLPGSAKYIRLRESVFNLWRSKKENLGYTEASDSEFAEFLLHRRSRSNSQRSENNPLLSPVNAGVAGAPRLYSTPLHPAARHPLNFSDTTPMNSDVDVTGTITGKCEDWITAPEETRSKLFGPKNISAGNPYSVLGSENVNVETDSDSEYGDIQDYGNYDSHYFPDLEKSLGVILEDLNNSDEDSSDHTDDDDDDGDDDDDNGAHSTQECSKDDARDGTQLVYEESMDISIEDDERTITMIDPFHGDSDPCNDVPDATEPSTDSGEVNPQGSGGQQEEPEESSKSAEKNREEIIDKLQNAFAQLTSVDELETYLALHSRMRVMVSIDKLLELSTETCIVENQGKICDKGLYAIQDVKTCGSRVEITRKCRNGHFKKWVSSEVLGVKNHNEFFLNDSLFAAAIIISGNNYSKFSLLCKALGLHFISSNTFTRFQKHCGAPVVKDIWEKMNAMIVDILKQYNEVSLCGDGRNDSPGHSARYCVYTLMEHTSKVVVDMAVIDKRETGGNSITMEKEGLRRLLEKMASTLPFSEITTDASTSIMKLVREMKEKFPQMMELFHSLDIWHKAKKLTKCLHQAARVKGCEPLKEWIDDIVNHFWFCCQSCEGSVEELKESWFGVLHHVCGEHTWVEGACNHSPDANATQGKTHLTKSSKAMAALRKVVLDKHWLNNLEFYVRFRHTSVLESYNSMLTKYAPKRMAFEYPYFIMRIMLAAIDHNMHLSRQKKLTAGGEERGHRKYSKRTQKFHAELVKEEKSYSYFPFLMAKMLKERCLLQGSFSQSTDDNLFNPKQIAPTIGMNAAPSTEELMKGPSRFSQPTAKSLTSPKIKS